MLKSHFLIDKTSLQWYILKTLVDPPTRFQLGSVWFFSDLVELNCEDLKKRLEKLLF